jgi:hypothetical protein
VKNQAFCCRLRLFFSHFLTLFQILLLSMQKTADLLLPERKEEGSAPPASAGLQS